MLFLCNRGLWSPSCFCPLHVKRCEGRFPACKLQHATHASQPRCLQDHCMRCVRCVRKISHATLCTQVPWVSCVREHVSTAWAETEAERAKNGVIRCGVVIKSACKLVIFATSPSSRQPSDGRSAPETKLGVTLRYYVSCKMAASWMLCECRSYVTLTCCYSVVGQ